MAANPHPALLARRGASGLVIASVLVALGDGFRSGADQAFLYRTCVALNRQRDFQRIEARAEAIAIGALVALVLTGGVIVQTGGFALGWLAETMLCLVGLLIAGAMVEPAAHSEPAGKRPLLNDSTPIPYQGLAVFIIPAAFLGGASSAASFLARRRERTLRRTLLCWWSRSPPLKRADAHWRHDYQSERDVTTSDSQRSDRCSS